MSLGLMIISIIDVSACDVSVPLIQSFPPGSEPRGQPIRRGCKCVVVVAGEGNIKKSGLPPSRASPHAVMVVVAIGIYLLDDARRRVVVAFEQQCML